MDSDSTLKLVRLSMAMDSDSTLKLVRLSMAMDSDSTLKLAYIRDLLCPLLFIMEAIFYGVPKRMSLAAVICR